MTKRGLPALLAAVALGAAAPPAPAAPEAGIKLSEEQGLLRHKPTGIALPATLAGIPRAANIPGDPTVIIYAPPGTKPDDPRRFVVGIGPAKAPPPVERMRTESRLRAAGGKTLDTLFEGAFTWPNRSGAMTFRASYLAGGMRKQYWLAWVDGYAIMVVAEWPADEPEQMERMANAVAGQVFGAATAGR